jgi:hypothetical protein
MVNYYRDLWQHMLHILAPLTAKTGASKKGEKHPPFQWTPETIRSAKKDNIYGASNIVLPCPSS